MLPGCNSLKKPILNTDMSYHPFLWCIPGLRAWTLCPDHLHTRWVISSKLMALVPADVSYSRMPNSRLMIWARMSNSVSKSLQHVHLNHLLLPARPTALSDFIFPKVGAKTTDSVTDPFLSLTQILSTGLWKGLVSPEHATAATDHRSPCTGSG